LVENFTEFKAPPNKYKDKAKKVSETSQEYGMRMLAVLMYWSIFAILGFVLSLFSVQTRQALFDNSRFRTLYLSFFMILLVLLGYYFSLFQYNILLLIFGLLLGSGISWGLLKALYKQQDEQP
jgi:H+/Cl- antiporter ClcA